MRSVIRIPADVWHQTRTWLFASGDERMAYLLARASVYTDPWQATTVDLLVRQALLIPDVAFTVQSPVRVELDPQFTRAVLVLCYESGLSLLDVHTHPFAGAVVSFSGHDIANMRTTHAEFRAGMPQDPPAVAASLVCGHDSVAAAWLDPDRGDISPVSAMRLIGHRETAVPLCAR